MTDNLKIAWRCCFLAQESHYYTQKPITLANHQLHLHRAISGEFGSEMSAIKSQKIIRR